MINSRLGLMDRGGSSTVQYLGGACKGEASSCRLYQSAGEIITWLQAISLSAFLPRPCLAFLSPFRLGSLSKLTL